MNNDPIYVTQWGYIMKWTILTGVALMLSACATPPEDIKATPVAANAYSGWDCNRLNSESAKVNAELLHRSTVQSQMATNDAIGVFAIGIPLGSLGTDNVKEMEAKLARLKGEAAALDAKRRELGCT